MLIVSIKPFKHCIFTFHNKSFTLKKMFFACLVIVMAFQSKAQFYYKDIITNKQLTADMAIYKEKKIRSFALKSFEDNGEPSESFFCTKKLSRDYKRTELFTRADMAPASLFVSVFDEEGKLLSTNDSSSIIVKNIQYKYDDKKRLVSITSYVRSMDADFNNSITEEHLYKYENNVLTQMQQIKNKKDTTLILFSTDEKGNVIVEKNTKTAGKHYYYYDSKNMVTDIVPAHNDGQRLRPDYIFEYNSAGLVTQMTSVEEGSGNYFVWKYSYDDGLRTKERCFTNEKRLMGSIEYEYK
jgi:hypothetical protein